MAEKPNPRRKPRDVTEPCPDCDGAGVVQGYYTMPPHVCDTCDGSGTIPKGEAEKMRAKSQETASAEGE